MRSHTNKTYGAKKIAVLAISAVVLLGAVIVAIAVFQSKASVTNKFKVETFQVKLEETFTPPEEWTSDNPVAKKVSYTNTGTLPALLRVQYAESWIDKDGLALSATWTNQTGDTKDVVVKNWNAVNGLDQKGADKAWTDGNDGWYYYNKVLEPSAAISILESIQLDSQMGTADNAYEKADYKLSFLHEYVKTDEVDALWGKTPTINGEKVTW